MHIFITSAAFAINIFVVFTTTVTAEPIPKLSELDQNVFKSLSKTQLKDLNGSYTKGYVSMNYILDHNMIEEVSAQMGEFDLKLANTEMHARLPKTKGTLSGIFKVDLVIKKFVPVDMRMGGHYTANISDVDLSIQIKLPTDKRTKMKLSHCEAGVSELKLKLVSEENDGSDILINLADWIGEAMQPSFSDLFCDTMQKILDQGPKSPIVQALGRRLCLLNIEKCPQ